MAAKMTSKLIKNEQNFHSNDSRLKVLCFHKKCLGNEVFGSNSGISVQNIKIKK